MHRLLTTLPAYSGEVKRLRHEAAACSLDSMQASLDANGNEGARPMVRSACDGQVPVLALATPSDMRRDGQKCQIGHGHWWFAHLLCTMQDAMGKNRMMS